jgi:hypothetical protein
MSKATTKQARTGAAGGAPWAPTQRSVPAAGQPVPATTAARSAFDLAATTRKPRTRIDLSQLEVRTDVPVPEIVARRKPGNSYPELARRMPVGGCVELPGRSACSLVSAGTKLGFRFTRRRLTEDGIYGVWRIE